MTTRTCIDCRVLLAENNKSLHQPKIRCGPCFVKFAVGVERFLGGDTSKSASQHAAEAAKEGEK